MLTPNDIRISADEARLLPKFREHAEMVTQQRRVLRDAVAVAGPSAPAPYRAKPVPSPGELRGVPVTGHGGTSPGTNPESAIDRLDRERERKARADEALSAPMVAFG